MRNMHVRVHTSLPHTVHTSPALQIIPSLIIRFSTMLSHIEIMGAQRFSISETSSTLRSLFPSPDPELISYRKSNHLDSQRYDPTHKSPESRPRINQQLSLLVDFRSHSASPTSLNDATFVEDSETTFVSGSEPETAIDTLDLYVDSRVEMLSRETLPRIGPVLEGAAAAEEEVSDTSCKIIRPIPISPVLSFFTRPSTPVGPRRTPPPSRPASPFYLLGCCTSSTNFEDDVDYFQSRRAKEQHGQSEAQIEVSHTQEVVLEKRWRQTVNSIMHDQEKAMQYLREKTAVC